MQSFYEFYASRMYVLLRKLNFFFGGGSAYVFITGAGISQVAGTPSTRFTLEMYSDICDGFVGPS